MILMNRNQTAAAKTFVNHAIINEAHRTGDSTTWFFQKKCSYLREKCSKCCKHFPWPYSTKAPIKQVFW